MRKQIIALFITVVVAQWMAAPAHAARIVDTDAAAEALSRGAILWDVRGAKDYIMGHIPGAVNIGTRVCMQLRTPVTREYVPVGRIENRLGEWGIDPGKEIVVYADKGSVCPYFLLVTLELAGAKNAHVYHGGIEDWKAAGRPMETTASRLAPVAVDLHLTPGVIVSTDEVSAALTRSDVQILDVRTPNEYKGLDVRALRGGHIPRAINIPYEQNWVDPESLVKSQEKKDANKDGFALKTRDQLKRIYAGLDPALETIVYCQSNPRASVTATVLKDLGFRDVRVYDASWVGYGNRFQLPAENESFFDVFALTNRLAAMQQRSDALEKQLGELKAAMQDIYAGGKGR